MAVEGADEGPELPGYLSVLQPEAEGRHHVENQVGVGGAGDHAEIVDTEGRIDAMGQLCDLIPEDNGCAVIRGDGVHVDHRLAAQLPVQLLFDVVDGVMDRHDAAGGRDLRVEGDHHPAGAVVMNHQIVNTGDLFVSHHQIFNFFNKFRRGGLSKQGIDGVLGGVYAALENEQCHQNTHPAIHRELEVMVSTGNEVREKSAILIQQDLQKIGIKTKIQTLDFPTLLTNARNGDYDLCFIGSAGSVDPSESVPNVTAGYMNNFAQLSDPTLGQIGESGAKEITFEARKKIYDQYQEELFKQMPMAFLYHTNDLFAYNEKLENVREGAIDYNVNKNVWEWKVNK